MMPELTIGAMLLGNNMKQESFLIFIEFRLTNCHINWYALLAARRASLKFSQRTFTLNPKEISTELSDC